MDFVWIKNREETNQNLVFSLDIKRPCDTLCLCAVDGYCVYLDGELCSYGPNFTVAGYSRKKVIPIKGVKKIEIKVVSYGVGNYVCDLQAPFFGAEVSSNGQIVYYSKDFTCRKDSCRLQSVPRFSRQRGFIEAYDFRKGVGETIEVYPVQAPVILDGLDEFCDYNRVEFTKYAEGVFTGYDSMRTPWWTRNVYEKMFCPATVDWKMKEDFLDKLPFGYFAPDYKLPRLRVGFIGLEIETQQDEEVILLYEEVLPDGKWNFCRDNYYAVMPLIFPKGKHRFISAEPYSLTYLRILHKGKIKVNPFLIEYENDRVKRLEETGDKRLDTVLYSATNSFMQNAVTLLIDCPGRERAGWLCDSFYTARAERFFTGENKIEQKQLENFILADTPEIDRRLFPMCCPAQFDGISHNTSWSLWLVLQFADYYQRTGDRALIDRAKTKIYRLLTYYDGLKNEYGLVENVPDVLLGYGGRANDEDYLSGVNFPTNMTLCAVLSCVARMYDDREMEEKAQAMREIIIKLSYNGELFVDNAIWVDGKLVPCENHTSEICQNYAVFFGFTPNQEYLRRIIENFGPLRDRERVYPEIEKADTFNGHSLRFIWLTEIGEYERVIKEAVEYFYPQAEITNTLWEFSTPKSSCTHGYVTIIASLLTKCFNEIKKT